jgi:hypothetical protein
MHNFILSIGRALVLVMPCLSHFVKVAYLFAFCLGMELNIFQFEIVEAMTYGT